MGKKMGYNSAECKKGKRRTTMSKIIRTRKPSVLPYYAAALAFVVLCAVLPVYRLWALLAALGEVGGQAVLGRQ